MDTSLPKLVLVLVVGGGLLAGLKALLARLETKVGTAPLSGPLPYRKCDQLMTPTELSFFHVLEYATSGQYRVHCKVRLEDLIYVPQGAENRQAHRNRIKSRHMDYVLCTPDTMVPRLAIELDDASHRAPRRQARDAFVNQALAAAGMPLLRVPVARAYDPNSVAESIASHVDNQVPMT